MILCAGCLCASKGGAAYCPLVFVSMVTGSVNKVAKNSVTGNNICPVDDWVGNTSVISFSLKKVLALAQQLSVVFASICLGEQQSCFTCLW